MPLRSEVEITLSVITEAEARTVADWRYDAPYDFYDGDETEVRVLLDPANQYFAVHADQEFVGFVCAGADARVAGQPPALDVDDIGYGFRPDITGQGIAGAWLPMAIKLLTDRITAPTQRVVIAAWNKRSQTVARRLGFDSPVEHINSNGKWIVMTRRVERQEG